VLHQWSARDIRAWHVALLVFVGACIAFPAFAVGAGVVIGIVVLFGVSAGVLLYFIRGYQPAES
jgi:hypothetical protein